MALSAAGMLLMPIFGLLLRFQPHFVHGLHTSASNAEINCYIVGGLYAGVFLVCNLLLALKTRAASTRNTARLPFVELESKEFVKAMDDMDRRTAVVPTSKQTLELPTKFPSKVDTM
ncbi:hypothetical protein GQ600_2925 [Phytophthora cactorum]|nr:hypothetical protein GQ600_2925 [Phytophthora cactorum]